MFWLRKVCRFFSFYFGKLEEALVEQILDGFVIDDELFGWNGELAPPVVVVAFDDVVDEITTALDAEARVVEDLLLECFDALGRDLVLENLGELLRAALQILQVLLENVHLVIDRGHVIAEDVRVHQGATGFEENFDSVRHKVDVDPLHLELQLESGFLELFVAGSFDQVRLLHGFVLCVIRSETSHVGQTFS